jgi:hypothetical protein
MNVDYSRNHILNRKLYFRLCKLNSSFEGVNCRVIGLGFVHSMDGHKSKHELTTVYYCI